MTLVCECVAGTVVVVLHSNLEVSLPFESWHRESPW